MDGRGWEAWRVVVLAKYVVSLQGRIQANGTAMATVASTMGKGAPAVKAAFKSAPVTSGSIQGLSNLVLILGPACLQPLLHTLVFGLEPRRYAL